MAEWMADKLAANLRGSEAAPVRSRSRVRPASMDIHVTDVMAGSIAAESTAPPTTPRLTVGGATEPKHRR